MTRITYIILLSLLMCISCKKDFLDKAPDETLDIESVFQERRYAESFLSSIYFNIPNTLEMSQSVERNPFTGASDELEITYTGAYSHFLNSGAWSSADTGPEIWNIMYEGIRKTNVFLENVARVPMDDGERTKWIGEATFLRAFYHFNLIRLYGAIPIVDATVPLDVDFLTIRRTPVDKAIDFVVNECDKAAPMLDWKVPADRYGRITRAAVVALKSQALLHMASPLFNGNPDYANVRDKEGVLLFPEFDAQRWEKAASAAKQAIDGVEANGYGLYYAADNDPVKNYQETFLVRHNREVLFAKNLQVHSHFERCANPTGYGGYSIYCPTQELVDAYEMANGQAPIIGYNADGSPIINAASGYTEEGFTNTAHSKGYYPADVSNMYINRDPRFYASINFNGAMWKGRKIEFYYTGIDGRQRAGSDYCISGYLMKKMVNPTSDIPQNRFTLNTFVHYRLGELYLNYAEALNESQGAVDDVYKYMNLIRARSGMPGLPAGLSQAQMRERVHHERQIELAFETHRYFDARRWKIAGTVFNRTIHGMNIQAGTNLKDVNFFKRTVIEKRIHNVPKHNLWPIQIWEIEKNPNLVQNIGW